MEKTKDQVVEEMYQAGLLNKESKAKYLADDSIQASQLDEIKQIIELCSEIKKENIHISAEKVHKMVWDKYFASKIKQDTAHKKFITKRIYSKMKTRKKARFILK